MLCVRELTSCQHRPALSLILNSMNQKGYCSVYSLSHQALETEEQRKHLFLHQTTHSSSSAPSNTHQKPKTQPTPHGQNLNSTQKAQHYT